MTDSSSSDEEVVDKNKEERLGIIARYDGEKHEESDGEAWEENFDHIDRFGFIHDSAVTNSDAEKTKTKKELSRTKKWLKMKKQWNSFQNTSKLADRTFKGIPSRVRGLIWSLFLGLNPSEEKKQKYQELFTLAKQHSQDVRQIDLDVNRTYRDHIMFRERYGTKQKSLFNLLCAYSFYNSEVGYCQGMSQVAAMLLVYMNEEESFWAFHELMTNPKFGMHGFFVAGFPKLRRFQDHHDKILAKLLPKLKHHLDKNLVDSGLYTLKWYFQCFLDRVPFELALRIWDVFLLQGERVLIYAAFSILKIHSKQLLAKKNMDEILNYLQTEIPNNFGVDSDYAMILLKKHSILLRKHNLDHAGEASADEFPKKRFGLVENIPKPVPVKKKKISPLPKIKDPLKNPADTQGHRLNDAETKVLAESESTSECYKYSPENISVVSSGFDDLGSVNHNDDFSCNQSKNTNEELQNYLAQGDTPDRGQAHTTIRMEPNSSIPITNETKRSMTHISHENQRHDEGSVKPNSCDLWLAGSQLNTAKEATLTNSVFGQTLKEGSVKTNEKRISCSTPPPPPPRSPRVAGQHSKSMHSTNANAARIMFNGTHISQSSPSSNHIVVSQNSMTKSNERSKLEKKVPPPVTPRRTSNESQNLEPGTMHHINSNQESIGCAVEVRRGETVRIHVPYDPPSSAGSSLTRSSGASSASNTSAIISKHDPNRIKINVPSY